MRKQAFNLNTVGQYGMRGAALGVGIGGVMELARQIKAEREDNARRKRRMQTSSDTIVIELPQAAGQKLAAAIKRATGEAPVDPAVANLLEQKGQIPASATTNAGPPDKWDPTTFAGSWLAGGAGLYGGYKIMAALGEKYREHMLKRRLEAAKKHHMEAILE